MRRPKPLKAARLAWLSMKLGALNAVQYRADFAIALLQTFIALATSIGTVSIVFAQTDTLGGWTRDELVALIGVFFIVRGLIDVVVKPSMERLMEGVRRGTLDFDLTKPADAQVLVSTRAVDIWRLVDVALGVIVLGVAMGRMGEQVGLDRALAFCVLLVAGLAIIYSFLLILTTLAFWLVRLENILVIFATVYEAGKWPIGIYPPWLRLGLDRRGADRVRDHRPGRDAGRPGRCVRGRGDGPRRDGVPGGLALVLATRAAVVYGRLGLTLGVRPPVAAMGLSPPWPRAPTACGGRRRTNEPCAVPSTS